MSLYVAQLTLTISKLYKLSILKIPNYFRFIIFIKINFIRSKDSMIVYTIEWWIYSWMINWFTWSWLSFLVSSAWKSIFPIFNHWIKSIITLNVDNFAIFVCFELVWYVSSSFQCSWHGSEFLIWKYGRTPSVEWRKLLTSGRPAFLRASSNDIVRGDKLKYYKLEMKFL